MHTAVLSGKVASPPEMSYTPDGKPIGSFLLEISQGQKPSGLVRVKCWGDLASFSTNACQPGSDVLIEGRIAVLTQQTANGTNNKVVEITAGDILVNQVMRDYREERSQQQAQTQKYGQPLPNNGQQQQQPQNNQFAQQQPPGQYQQPPQTHQQQPQNNQFAQQQPPGQYQQPPQTHQQQPQNNQFAQQQPPGQYQQPPGQPQQPQNNQFAHQQPPGQYQQPPGQPQQPQQPQNNQFAHQQPPGQYQQPPGQQPQAQNNQFAQQQQANLAASFGGDDVEEEIPF